MPRWNSHKSVVALSASVVFGLAALVVAAVVQAQDEMRMDGMGNIESPASSAESPAAQLYQAKCAQCHDNPVGRVPPRASLRYRPAESVYQALASGVMSPMAQGLSDDQIISLVELLTGRAPRPIVDPSEHLCESAAQAVVLQSDDWSSVHGDKRGQRYRDSAVFSSANIDQLKLKWAYAYPGGAKGPATVAGNSIFVAGTGYVVSLNAGTGCTNWAYPIEGRTVRAITLAQAPNKESTGSSAAPTSIAVFGDDSNTVTALDATTGKALWKTIVGEHVLARITAAPTVHEGVVYVPLSAMEDPLTHDEEYFCCSARGGVAAVSLSTGELLWKQEHITQPLVSLVDPSADAKLTELERANKALAAAHAERQFQQGPAGASTYTPLTIDVKRALVYATTAEEYGFTDAPGPYSVIGYDLKTGKRAWQTSLLPTVAERDRICAERDTDCRNFFSTGTSALLHSLSKEKDIIVVAQKSGMVHGLDPDNNGKIVWSTQVADGGDLGGVMYGMAANASRIFVPVSDVDSPDGRLTGSLVALDPATGAIIWRTTAPKPACSWKPSTCIGGQVAAVTVLSDMVFTGFWDGYVRIYAAKDGRLLREIDAAQEFPAVNGTASGGQVSGYPLSIAKEALYINSGASSIMKSGNALLKFTLEGK